MMTPAIRPRQPAEALGRGGLILAPWDRLVVRSGILNSPGILPVVEIERDTRQNLAIGADQIGSADDDGAAIGPNAADLAIQGARSTGE